MRSIWIAKVVCVIAHGQAIGPWIGKVEDAHGAALRAVVSDVGDIQPILVDSYRLDIDGLGAEVEGALDLPVQTDAVRHSAIARIVDGPIEVSGPIDGETR